MNPIERGFEILGIVALMLAIFYRKEIAVAYKNRALIAQAAQAANAYDEIRGALQ